MKVCVERCRNCLFEDESLLTEADRVRKIETTAAADSYFICHEATARGEDVMCRGWWDELRWATNPGRIAERLGIRPSWKPTGPATDREFASAVKAGKRGVAERRAAGEPA